LTEQSDEDILELLIASDELLIEELFNHVQDYLIEKRTEWIQKNFSFVLHIAFKLTNCKKLQDYIQVYLIEKQTEWIQKNFSFVLNIAFKFTNCKKLQDYILESICKDSYSFITSNEFLSLDKDIIYKVLERDDLQIKEVVVWNHLIKWGIEQISDLGNEKCDINKLNNEDYEELKEILYQFIPLIRFVEITSDDFKNKIKPYRTIIPNQIYEEIKEFYNKGIFPKITTLPPRIGNFDSKIIKPKLAKIIIKWINKEDFWISRYNFKLIYRGSTDGISTGSFKSKCKGRVESLVLIKVKQTNKIFGGYSSIGFNSIGDSLLHVYDYNQRFYYSSDNFIFSFENEEDTQNMKISRVVNYSKAMYDYHTTGFDFGFNSLYINNYRCLRANNNDHNYEDNLNTSAIYDIEEIEAFTITK
jgi:hypothetical protein